MCARIPRSISKHEEHCRIKDSLRRQAGFRAHLAGQVDLYILMRSGELASIKVGKKRLIPGTAIDAFVERRLEASN